MESKFCLVCDKKFFRTKKYSIETWNATRKYCSVPCKNQSLIGKPNPSNSKFRKGQPSFNKGKIGLRREKHPRWRGGRYKQKGRYILVLRSEHPFPDSKGYVKEHRLVMEASLGRFLDPKEVVHHINEIKDDNRLENLMLFEDNGKHTAYHLKYLRKKLK